jgi:3-hydroxyisobutyrate dehydrogenase-like beta-hydroxyacid dehydrogenase
MGNKVAVIGLGRMGAALAAAMLQSNYQVTVWNRTVSKAAPLVKAGAVQAETAAEAIAANEIFVVCLGNYQDSQTVLTDCGDLDGKLLIQLTSGTTDDAEKLQKWALKKGALYLDGVISAYPSGIGKAETVLVVAGSEKAWAIGKPVITCLGGESRYVGDSLTAPIALQFAIVAPTLMLAMGVIQGIHVLEREGFDLNQYAEIISGMSPLLTESIERQANAIARDSFTDTEAALETWAAGLEHYVHTFGPQGCDFELMKPVRDLLSRAVAAGYGSEEVAAAIKVLRRH